MASTTVPDNDSDSRRAVFDQIFRTNAWKGEQSVSGRGSDPSTTVELRARLPQLLRDLGVRKMLDLPCGDYLWMGEVVAATKGLDYTGADIVEELIRNNQQRYGNARTRFQALDLCNSPLPDADLLLCRDCLVHLCFADLFKALRNIAASNIRYIATTSFPRQGVCMEIPTGKWRPINLEKAPFLLPPPTAVLDERYGNGIGPYADKTLSVWPVSVLRDALNSSVSADNGATRDILALPGALPQDEFLALLGAAATGKTRQAPSSSGLWKEKTGHFKSRNRAPSPGSARPALAALPSEFNPHIEAFRQHDQMQAEYSLTPVVFAQVRLGSLAVTQPYLEVGKLRPLIAGLAETLSRHSLAEVCLPLPPEQGSGQPVVALPADSAEWRAAGVKVLPHKAKAIQVTLHASSHDLRISLIPPTGVLNVIRYGDQLILNGGHYLAFALMALGHEYAPCLVQVCGSSEDLRLVANASLSSRPDPLQDTRRPALLEDFLDDAVAARTTAARGSPALRLMVALDSSAMVPS